MGFPGTLARGKEPLSGEEKAAFWPSLIFMEQQVYSSPRENYMCCLESVRKWQLYILSMSKSLHNFLPPPPPLYTNQVCMTHILHAQIKKAISQVIFEFQYSSKKLKK